MTAEEIRADTERLRHAVAHGIRIGKRVMMVNLEVLDAIFQQITELRRQLSDKQSYDDLAASGGIVDAP